MADSSSFRQLEGVGVSGLLAEDCRVLYTHLFSQRHLGRISDLIAAKLRGSDEAAVQDELKLRALLLFAAFEAWRSRAAGEPLALECGYDETHVAVGVTFKLSARDAAQFPGLLDDLTSKSNTVVVRTNPGTGTIEIVSILKRGEIEAASGNLIEVEIPADPPEAPKPVEVIELGDLDYSRLLVADGPADQELEPSPAGEIIAKGFVEKEESRKVEGNDERDDSSRTVEAGESEKLHSFKISGDNEVEKDDAVRIAADPSKKSDEEEVRFAAEPQEKKKKGFFSKVLAFTQGEAEEEKQAEVPAITEGEPSPDGELPAIIASDPNVEVEADASTAKLLTEFQEEVGGMDKVLNKAQADATQMKRDERIKRWADGLMGELLTEKARLAELSKRISLSVRQKEIEFRNKERVLQQEIRARDENYKQEHHRLNRMKDQLTQANMTVERLKSGNVSGADDGHFKAKFAHVQKLLVNAKDENVVLKTQLEDAKGELNQLRQTVKRQNQMLNERGPAEKKGQMQVQRPSAPAAPAGVSEDVKKKLDLATQQTSKAMKEAELYRLKYEETHKEELRLKGEILRLQRQIANPGTSGGSSMTRSAAKPGAGKPPKAA